AFVLGGVLLGLFLGRARVLDGVVFGVATAIGLSLTTYLSHGHPLDRTFVAGAIVACALLGILLVFLGARLRRLGLGAGLAIVGGALVVLLGAQMAVAHSHRAQSEKMLRVMAQIETGHTTRAQVAAMTKDFQRFQGSSRTSLDGTEFSFNNGTLWFLR